MLSLWRLSRPWVRVVAVVLLVGVAGTGVYWFGFRDEQAQAATPESTTTAVAASRTTFQQSVSASGTLAPAVQEDVNFDVTGTVTAVDVAAGDTVTAGQQLATVDTLSLNAALLQAKAELASAQASWSNARSEADGSASSTAQVASLAAQVDVAQAAVAAAEADMAGATLTAPAAGLVTAVNLAVGDTVSGGSATGGNNDPNATDTAQFVIIGTEAWQVSVSVGETDVAMIEVGDQVEITTKSSADTLYGTVGEIGLLSTSTNGVAAFPVVVDVTGTPEGVHDGESADVSIIYERRTDVLSVPAAAVTTEDGRTVVTQEGADGEQVATEVTVGATSGNMVEIIDGLTEGDEVLVTTFAPRVSGSDGGDGATRMPDGMTGEGPAFVFEGELPDGAVMIPAPGGGNG